ncbi:MAG: flagellar biosynthetic protein FliO [Desulfobacterium sp.]|nr:flagellar biosynthetic protein FliO [Desulfobacterium sp.]
MEPGSYLQSLTVIFVILGFLILVLLGIKRYGVRFGLSSLKQHRELTIEAHLSLGPKRDVCVVRYKDKKFLLGATDSGITLLAVVDESSTDNKVAANKSTQTTLTS